MKYQIKDTLEEITNPITGKKYTRTISTWHVLHNSKRAFQVFFITLDYNTDDIDGEQISILFDGDAIDVDYER